MDEQYHHAYDDFDYQMRIRQAGFKIVVNSNIRLYHWERSNGINRALNRKNNLARFWKRWGNFLVPDMWDFMNARITLVLKELVSPIYVKIIDLCSVRSEARTILEIAYPDPSLINIISEDSVTVFSNESINNEKMFAS